MLKGETVFYRAAFICGLEFCSRGSDNRQMCSPIVHKYGAQLIPGNYDGTQLIPGGELPLYLILVPRRGYYLSTAI